MNTSEKLQEMSKVIKKHSYSFVNQNESYKYYIAPKIDDKIIKKLIKHFDNHLPANSIVAFFDTTLFCNASRGYLFTTDGFYYKYLTKATFFQYADIADIFPDGSMELRTAVNGSHTVEVSDVLDTATLQVILRKLIQINEYYGYSNIKATGKVQKIDLPNDMRKKCEVIIHSASVACGGVGTGLAQIPASDNAVIVPLQIGMIVSLGTVFELHITESVAKSIISSVGASIAGRAVTQFLWGWIPVFGNAINTATAAGITEAIGWIAVKNFYERWLDDKTKGRFEGMKDGYAEASGEYERKLREQADAFFLQMKDIQRERDEYEKLLDEYEAYIQKLEAENAALNTIVEIKGIYEKLKSLESTQENDNGT